MKIKSILEPINNPQLDQDKKRGINNKKLLLNDYERDMYEERVALMIYNGVKEEVAKAQAIMDIISQR